MSWFISPRRKSVTAGMRMPSSKWVRAAQLSEPATTPPTSDQWAVAEVKAISSPSWKMGLMKWMSLQWVLAT